MQDKDKQQQWEQLAKLLSGNATEAEKSAITDAELQEAKQLWDKTAPTTQWEPDAEKAWQRFKVKAQAREEEPVNKYIPKAAARNLYRWWLASAAAVLLLLAGVWVIYQKADGPEMVIVATLANQQQEVLLPDGSQVWLNENSRISYAKSFSVDSREVLLEGEAFFEVQKAEGKRFTILAQGTVTEVIGTSFNLSAYPKLPVKIQVVEGKVAFADAKVEEAIFLGPGEEAVIRRSATAAGEMPQKQEIEDPNFRAWQTKELQFANTSLGQLSKTLSSYYDVEIQLQNAALGNCRFTADFKQPALEEVLEVLRLTGNFTITKTQQGYLIAGDGCQ